MLARARPICLRLFFDQLSVCSLRNQPQEERSSPHTSTPTRSTTDTSVRVVAPLRARSLMTHLLGRRKERMIPRTRTKTGFVCGPSSPTWAPAHCSALAYQPAGGVDDAKPSPSTEIAQ